MTFKKIKNKLVFIVGGSEGIGLALAQSCAQSGAHIVLFSKTISKLEKAIESLPKVHSEQRFSHYSCDISNWNESQQILSQAVRDHGTPDILLNMAGFAKPGFFEDQPLEDIKSMVDLNLFGIIHACKVIAPYMIQRKSGIILNTSSMCGFLGLFGYTGYCASKFAVIGFSEALRRELKPFHIQVSVLCPPNTKTPGLEKENQSKPEEVLKTEEKAKVVEPDYVARQTLKQLLRGSFMILPTFDGRLAYYLNRLSPKILDFFIKRPDPN